MQQNLIGVVDCNNFFVSCERLFRPDLQNQPVVVLSSNDGCVVARSQEVKDMNIPMGVPYFKVKDIIKDSHVTIFSSHFALYRDVSRRVFTVLDGLLDEVQQYSVDEAFFTVPSNSDVQKIMNIVQERIECQVGIPVSVGVAASKTLAKYAVEYAKRTTGQYELTSDLWEKQCADVPLTKLWGVGVRSARRFDAAGYKTAFDLQTADSARVKSLFGVTGERLRSELKGEIAFPVTKSIPDQKSMMSTRSFKATTSNLAVLEDAIAYHTRHIATDLRRKNQLARIVRISIQASRHSDFFLQGGSYEMSFDIPTNDTFALLAVTQRMLRQVYKAGVPYKKAGVIVSQLTSSEVQQTTLFTDQATVNNNKLLSVIDAINSSVNGELITLGARQREKEWQARRDLQSPAYTTKWTDVAIAKAVS